MLRLLSTLAVVLVAAATPTYAQSPAPVPTTLDRDGVRARYTTSLLAGDVIAIRGETTDTHEALELMVDSRGRVSGSIGSGFVDFTVPLAKRNALVSTLKQEATVADLAPGTMIEASLR